MEGWVGKMLTEADTQAECDGGLVVGVPCPHGSHQQVLEMFVCCPLEGEQGE